MKIKSFIINACFFILISTVVVRAVYRYFNPSKDQQEQALNLDNNLASARVQHMVDPEGQFDVPVHTAYDFNAMLDLIDAARGIQKRIRDAFNISRREGYKAVAGIDIDNLHMLHRQLLTERRKLRDYIWDLKGHSRAGLPTKKDRSLQYYMQVLDESIVDMKELMRGFFSSPGKQAQDNGNISM